MAQTMRTTQQSYSASRSVHTRVTDEPGYGEELNKTLGDLKDLLNRGTVSK